MESVRIMEVIEKQVGNYKIRLEYQLFDEETRDAFGIWAFCIDIFLSDTDLCQLLNTMDVGKDTVAEFGKTLISLGKKDCSCQFGSEWDINYNAKEKKVSFSPDCWDGGVGFNLDIKKSTAKKMGYVLIDMAKEMGPIEDKYEQIIYAWKEEAKNKKEDNIEEAKQLVRNNTPILDIIKHFNENKIEEFKDILVKVLEDLFEKDDD